MLLQRNPPAGTAAQKRRIVAARVRGGTGEQSPPPAPAFRSLPGTEEPSGRGRRFGLPPPLLLRTPLLSFLSPARLRSIVCVHLTHAPCLLDRGTDFPAFSFAPSPPTSVPEGQSEGCGQCLIKVWPAATGFKLPPVGVALFPFAPTFSCVSAGAAPGKYRGSAGEVPAALPRTAAPCALRHCPADSGRTGGSPHFSALSVGVIRPAACRRRSNHASFSSIPIDCKEAATAPDAGHGRRRGNGDRFFAPLIITAGGAVKGKPLARSSATAPDP